MTKIDLMIFRKAIAVVIIICMGFHWASATVDTVTTNADSGPGSLRELTLGAARGDTIVFDPSTNGNPIMLNSGTIEYFKFVNFIGNGMGQTIIDGSLDTTTMMQSWDSSYFYGITFQYGGGPLTNYGGGAVRINQEYVAFVECEFAYNQDIAGAAIRSQSENLHFISCIFHHNGTNLEFGIGGAIAQFSGRLTLVNNLFYRNYTGFGGVIYSFGTLDFKCYNNTIANNKATEQGGGIFGISIQNIELYNNIFSMNTAPSNPDLSVTGTLGGSVSNIISSTTGYSFTDGVIVDVPNFVDTLLDNYRLNPNSRGVNEGTVNSLPADQFDLDQDGDVMEELPIDLEGQERVRKCILDIGAYENDVKKLWVTSAEVDSSGNFAQIIDCAEAGDTICFDPSLNGLPIFVNSTVTIAKDLIIQGNGMDSTILDGNNMQARFFTIVNCFVRMDGLCVRKAARNNSGTFGGAITTNGSSTKMNVTNCRFTQNGGFSVTGGVLVLFGGKVNLFNCVIDNNKAIDIAAIYALDTCELTMNQCLIRDNESFTGTAALVTANSSLDLRQSTFVNNKINQTNNPSYVIEIVDGGAGTSNFECHNNIFRVTGNSQTTFGISPSVNTNTSYNCVNKPGDFPMNDIGNFNQNPQLLSDYKLNTNSPCINRGPVDSLPIDMFDFDNDGDTLELIEHDLAGNDRVIGCDVDLGVYEHQQYFEPLVRSRNNDGVGSLRAAIDCAEDGDTIFITNEANGTIQLYDSAIIIDNKELTFLKTGNFGVAISGDLDDSVRLFTLDNESALTFFEIDFINGGGPGVFGGGAFDVQQASKLKLIECELEDNYAKVDGGAISVGTSSYLYALNCVFKGNDVETFASTIVFTGNSKGDIDQCVFYENGGSANSIMTTISGSEMNVRNSTFANNEVASAIKVVAGLNCYNTIFSSSGAAIDYLVGTTDLQYNLVDSAGDLPVGQMGNLFGVAKFINGNLGNFGLTKTSAGINAGKDELAPKDLLDLDFDGDTTDFIDEAIDGADRFYRCRIDMGAYENLDKSIVQLVDNTTDGADGSLRNLMQCAETGDTIIFDSSTNGIPQILSLGVISSNKILDIFGNGSDSTVIQGDPSNPDRLFNIDGRLEFRDMSFMDGGGAAVNGGGAMKISDAQVTVLRCDFMHNSAGGFGGGALYISDSDFHSGQCRFINNSTTSPFGSGGVAYIDDNSDVKFHQNLLAKNHCSIGGSSVFVDGSYIDVLHSTFADNVDAGGAGDLVLWESNLDLYYNIFSSDSLAAVHMLTNDFTLNTAYNLTDNPGNIDTSDLGNLLGMVVFENPDSNNYQLQGASMAINVGPDTLTTIDRYDLDQDGSISDVLGVDLAGNTRVLDCRLDLGAYEYVPADLLIEGLMSYGHEYETGGAISSSQQIVANNIVIYDSPVSIDLNPGFEVQLGTVFQTRHNGCDED